MAATSNSKIFYVCLVLSFGGFANSFDGLSIMDIKDVLRFGVDTMRDVLESWEMIRPKTPGDEENSLPFVYRMEKELRNSISRVSDKIEIYQNRMEIRVDAVVARLLTDLPLQEKLDLNLRLLDQYIGQINDLYYNFVTYVTATAKYERYTLEDFARTCVSSRSGALPDLLKRIHRLLVPHSDADFNASILVLLANKMQVSSEKLLDSKASPSPITK